MLGDIEMTLWAGTAQLLCPQLCHCQGQGSRKAPRLAEVPPSQPQPALPQRSARAHTDLGFKLGPSQAAPGMAQPTPCGVRCHSVRRYGDGCFLLQIPPPLPGQILPQEGSATSGLRPVHPYPQRQQGGQVEGGKGGGQDPALTAKRQHDAARMPLAMGRSPASAWCTKGA